MFKIILSLIKFFSFLYSLYHFGLFYGILFYCISFKIYIWTIENIFTCELIDSIDLIFLYEYENRPNVIISNLITDKISFEELKTLIVENGVKKIKKMRQRIFTFLNEYYWKEVDLKFIIENNIFEIKQNFDYNDLIRFNEEHFSIHMNRNKPLWEVYLVENYKEDLNKSVIVFKFHHALADGNSLVNLFSNFSINLNKLAEIKPISFFRKTMLYLMSPYYTFKARPKINPEIQNPFKNNLISNYGKKFIKSTKLFQFEKFKNIYKKFPNTTFNDLAWTIICRALIKFSNNNNSNNGRSSEYNSLSGSLAISSRLELDKSTIDNQSIMQIVDYLHQEDFENDLIIMSNKLKSIKNKQKSTSSLILTNIFGKYLLNEYIVKSVGEELIKQVSFIYTNVRGPETKIQLKTEKRHLVDNIINIVPLGSLVFSIVSFTYDGMIRFVFNCDRKSNLDVDEIVKYLQNEIEEVFKLD